MICFQSSFINHCWYLIVVLHEVQQQHQVTAPVPVKASIVWFWRQNALHVTSNAASSSEHSQANDLRGKRLCWVTRHADVSAQFLQSQQDRCKAYLERASFLSPEARSGGGGGRFPQTPKLNLGSIKYMPMSIRSEDVSFEVPNANQ